jgi:hypothetical protein
LYWRVCPACVYAHLEQFTGRASYFGPILGPGVYLFIHGNGQRYQVYYVGQSEEMGRRLADRYADYVHARQSGYWLPTDKSGFDRDDLYELFRREPGDLFAQEGKGFGREKRAEVGAKIMQGTYFAFAGIVEGGASWLKDVEATLQAAIAKKHDLPRRGTVDMEDGRPAFRRRKGWDRYR